jgi:Ca-activated chloride channel family protein
VAGEGENNNNEQRVPSGELTADQQGMPETSIGTADVSDINAGSGLMTKEEAMKMLQAVRDRDMLRRLQQQRRERLRHVPVERDW